MEGNELTKATGATTRVVFLFLSLEGASAISEII
jgi:hypothetical protein